jgi:hypothetical protein
LNMIRALIVILLWALCAQTGADETRTVVLAVRADSHVLELDSITLRKLFLGLPVLVDGSLLHPVRNRSDDELDPIFLQQVVAMSQSAYERQILIGVNRQGWLRPLELRSLPAVLNALYDDPNAVSFMWLRDVQRNPRIRIIRVIWSG